MVPSSEKVYSFFKLLNTITILVNFYETINEDITQFEIIYIGLDENEEKYKETVRDMPWLFYDFKEAIKY